MSSRADPVVAPPAGGNAYVAGADVRLRVEDAEGAARQRTFRLLRYCGGGFGADVWQARDARTRRLYALKLFAAQRGLLNRARKRLRDLAHLLWFQSPYPYRALAPAVRHALLVRKLLHALSVITEGAPFVVDAEGWFWEPRHRTYGLVLEWVEGRTPRYAAPDRHSGNRRSRRETPRWLAQQRRWMAWARAWGFDEQAAQVYAAPRWGGAWFSLTNVIYAADGGARFDPRRLRWLDLEPALPHVLWCFAYHRAWSARAWRRGVFPSFDRVDAAVLHRALAALEGPTRHRQAERLAAVGRWCARLGAARRQYDRQRLNVWQHRWALVTDRRLRCDIREGLLAYWQRAGRISARGRRQLMAHPWQWVVASGLGLLPALGGVLRRCGWHEGYRRHLRRMLTDASYALRVWRRGARQRVWIWRQEGRLPPGPMERHPLRAWWAHGWRAALLPERWHRWTADARYRARWWQGVLAFCWDTGGARQHVYRGFFLRMLQEERARHQLTRAEYRRLAAAVRRPALACYLEGHYLYVLPKVFFWALAGALAVLGLTARAPALLVAALLVGGVYREVVTWWLRWRHPRVPLGWALSLAWLPKVGSAACTVQMARGLRRGERRLLFVCLRRLVTAATRLAPLLGGEGTLLEYYAIRLWLDAPYAAWRRWRRRWSPGA